MHETRKTRTRNAEDKRRRILAAAQQLFTRKGYSQTSIKDIAHVAEVSPALVIKHFDNKIGVFKLALIESLIHSSVYGISKAEFSQRIVTQITSGTQGVLSPSIIALSLDDEEARAVASCVANDFILKPTAEWLCGPEARERALHIMVLSLGLALVQRLFDGEHRLAPDAAPATWIAEEIDRTLRDPSAQGAAS